MTERGDVIDQGNTTAELFLDLALKKRKPAGPEATGFCLNCDEPLEFPHRWCEGGECRADWAARQAAGK